MVIGETGHPAARGTKTGAVVLESFSYDDQIVRMFATATLIWGIVAFLVGLIVAVLLVLPWASFGLPYLSFGRLRPLHTNAAIFAFAGNAIFAAV
ncbi:MAG: cbb3-type cytochrome c oxidase subunit I, partial [Planctomycetota bacterium]